MKPETLIREIRIGIETPPGNKNLARPLRNSAIFCNLAGVWAGMQGLSTEWGLHSRFHRDADQTGATGGKQCI